MPHTSDTALLEPASRVEAHPTAPPAPTLPERAHLLALIGSFLTVRGGLAAWQGPSDAPSRWVASTGPSDLDLWCSLELFPRLDRMLIRAGGVPVTAPALPGRLRHHEYLFETSTGLAVLDVTVGDLMVGPVRLLPASQVSVLPGRYGPVLSGPAAVADLLVRPLLRGRLVTGDRLAQARGEWGHLDTAARESFTAGLSQALSPALAREVREWLEGADPSPRLLARARALLARRSLAPRSLRSTYQARRSILPTTRKSSAGLPARGVLVVLAGTDGSGKSTLAQNLTDRLDDLDVESTNVYMGMGRGNLPGVGLARNLLGVKPAPEPAAAPHATTPAPQSLGMAPLRRVAAWYYLVEYVYRWNRHIGPQLRAGRVVISDRYIYDLRSSPWPRSHAAEVAEWLLPAPQVLLVPDAPDALIHARKPERHASDQAAQQQSFRDLAWSAPASVANLLVDTSGRPGGDVLAPSVAAVLKAMHRPS